MTDKTTTEMEKIDVCQEVLVIGEGPVGLQTAKTIAGQGYPVLLAGTAQLENSAAQKDDTKGIEILTQSQMAGVAGMPGDFKVWLSNDDQVAEKRVGAIVVAQGSNLRPLNEAYGLKLDDRVVAQSQLEATLADDPKQLAGKTVAFVVGLAQAGNPVNMKRVFQSALILAEVEDCSVYVYVGDLKVASDQLERLYMQTRDNGTLYFKLNQAPDIFQQNGSLGITYDDPIIRKPVTLEPDLIVVEEAIEPDAANSDLAEMLRIDLSPSGFMQTDNVHRYPVSTNREGIYVVGTSREINSLSGASMDAQNAALQIEALLGNGTRSIPTGTTLDAGKCTFCLTCYRCCPHGAIYWENESNTVISPLACQGCGICASECPMDAIQIGDYSDTQMHARIKERTSADTDSQKIIAFCCQNSAIEAGQVAKEFNMDLPAGLQVVQVPCAGKVDLDYILTAFVEGADGVLVLACHTGNCKAERGNAFGEWRVKEAQRMLTEIGMDAGKLRFATLAANMGTDFARIVNEMAEDLKAQ